MLEQVRYFPYEHYRSMPWRNALGTTQEVVREPADAESFAWRLSLATVNASGPFSAYPGYERAVALVAGRGFRLHVKDAPTQLLGARGEHALFCGSAQTECELLDGPCTDLSLMVRRPGRIHAVALMRIESDNSVSADTGSMQALFVLHGAIECRALPPLLTQGTPDAGLYTLKLNDTLLIPGSGQAWSAQQASSEVAEVLVLTFAAARTRTGATTHT